MNRGAPGDSFANEPAPSGNFIDLGTYGNTGQASLSPAQYVLVLRPYGGEVWPPGQSFAVRWRSHDFTGDAKIELLDAAGTNIAQEIVATTSLPMDDSLS